MKLIKFLACCILISCVSNSDGAITDLLSSINTKTVRTLNTVQTIVDGVLQTVGGLFGFLKPKSADYATIVDVPKLGKVGGMIKSFSEDKSKSYYQYKGIPYAETVERLELAVAKKAWSGIHNGKIEGKVCPQLGDAAFYTGNVDERNCLVLTVTTPQNPNNRTRYRPVLVYYYGGAFVLGTTYSSWYDPELLVFEDIIVVQIAYRLGIFGWLTDGKIIPKNIGLKDCLLGLQWVHDYIHAFGGDASKVTIYGESAGSIITANLWQAPKAANLMSGAILQSGTSINAMSFQTDPAEAFKKFVENSACAVTLLGTIEEQVQCVKATPSILLSLSSGWLTIWNDLLQVGFVNGLSAAVVQEDASDPNAIVTEPPFKHLANGTIPTNKPVLISITNDEMLSFSIFINLLRVSKNSEVVPLAMRVIDREAAGKKVKEYYAKSELGFAIASDEIITRVGSDMVFNNGFYKFIELLQSRNTPLYCMLFNYASSMGLFNINGKVGHADDLFYIWKLEAISLESIRKFIIPPLAYRKRKQILRLFANFVKTKNPTPIVESYLDNVTWPLVTDFKNTKCLNFKAKLDLIVNPNKENYAFWDALPKKDPEGF